MNFTSSPAFQRKFPLSLAYESENSFAWQSSSPPVWRRRGNLIIKVFFSPFWNSFGFTNWAVAEVCSANYRNALCAFLTGKDGEKNVHFLCALECSSINIRGEFYLFKRIPARDWNFPRFLCKWAFASHLISRFFCWSQISLIPLQATKLYWIFREKFSYRPRTQSFIAVLQWNQNFPWKITFNALSLRRWLYCTHENFDGNKIFKNNLNAEDNGFNALLCLWP